MGEDEQVDVAPQMELLTSGAESVYSPQELHQRLIDSAGSGTPLHVERTAGLGHAMPEDLTPILERALDWIASAQPV